jgi:predicted dithiol-disulfide oxidoreductase (DUF899 family)
MGVSFPGESAAYRAARDRLLDEEIALRRAMEAVARARRALPPGGAPPNDYLFEGEGQDGVVGDVRLSALFHPDQGGLALYSFMFPRAAADQRPGPAGGSTAQLALGEGPCPSCVALLDQLDGAAPHIGQRMALAVVAKAPLERLLAFKAERGWRHLRLLSCAANTYQRDYLGEDAAGDPAPMLNVFTRGPDGVRHFWGSELLYAPSDPGQDPRHLGVLEPMWNLLDLGPEGRPAGFEEQLDYGGCRPG